MSVAVTLLLISVISYKPPAVHVLFLQTWFNGIACICAELNCNLVSASLHLLEVLSCCLFGVWDIPNSLPMCCVPSFWVCSPRWLLFTMVWGFCCLKLSGHRCILKILETAHGIPMNKQWYCHAICPLLFLLKGSGPFKKEQSIFRAG